MNGWIYSNSSTVERHNICKRTFQLSKRISRGIFPNLNVYRIWNIYVYTYIFFLSTFQRVCTYTCAVHLYDCTYMIYRLHWDRLEMCFFFFVFFEMNNCMFSTSLPSIFFLLILLFLFWLSIGNVKILKIFL